MDIYKTYGSGKNEIITQLNKEDAIEFINEYILHFTERTYGSNAKKIIEQNTMDEDKWFYMKDCLPTGHYFIERIDGYNVYVIYETEEVSNSFFSFSSTYRQKHTERIFSVFGLSAEHAEITQSIAQIKTKIEDDTKYKQHTDPWRKMAAQVADIANARKLNN